MISTRELTFGGPEIQVGECAAEMPTEDETPIPNLKEALNALEQNLIHRALAHTGGHQVRAALMLGISERMLRYKLKKHGGT